MADQSRAEARLGAALSRLEAAVTGVATRRKAAGNATVNEHEQLLIERDRLRRRLEELDGHNARLRAVAGELDGELGEAISRIDGLTGS